MLVAESLMLLEVVLAGGVWAVIGDDALAVEVLNDQPGKLADAVLVGAGILGEHADKGDLRPDNEAQLIAGVVEVGGVLVPSTSMPPRVLLTWSSICLMTHSPLPQYSPCFGRAEWRRTPPAVRACRSAPENSNRFLIAGSCAAEAICGILYIGVMLKTAYQRIFIFKERFRDIVKGEVVRYELSNIRALNFVMYAALGGGVTRSLSVDMHGKAPSSYLLNMEI